jgi:hypothetical protein
MTIMSHVQWQPAGLRSCLQQVRLKERGCASALWLCLSGPLAQGMLGISVICSHRASSDMHGCACAVLCLASPPLAKP